MTGSDAIDVVKAFADDHLTPFMRGRGFRRRGAHFTRCTGGLWRVLNLQRTAWGSVEETQFTFNLAIASEAERSLRLLPRNRSPIEYQALATRIGDLMTPPRDTWWVAQPSRDPEDLANAVLPVIIERALPWLDAFADDAALLDELLARPRSRWLTVAAIGIEHDRPEAVAAAVAEAEHTIASAPRRGVHPDVVDHWKCEVALIGDWSIAR